MSNGDWNWEKANGNEYWVFDNNNNAICEVSAETDIHKNILNREIIISNAKLIAASPDLLRACNMAKIEIENGRADQTTLTVLENAINKALD